MLEYDRIDVSEGIDSAYNKLISRDVGCAIFGIFWAKILIMKGICVTAATI